MSDLVTRLDEDGICWLTLNRPDKLNSLTVGMFRELRQHVIDLKKDDTVGCVILRGAGKCFSAGLDLGDIAEGAKWPSRRISFLQRGQQSLRIRTPNGR